MIADPENLKPGDLLALPETPNEPECLVVRRIEGTDPLLILETSAPGKFFDGWTHMIPQSYLHTLRLIRWTPEAQTEAKP